MGSQRIVLTRSQFNALLGRTNSEPMDMASSSTRTLAQLGEDELTPELRASFDEAAKSGKCTCGCGKKAGKNTRGLSEPCWNKFRSNRNIVRRKHGLPKAHEWDRDMQREGKILPPGWGRQQGDFSKARRQFEKRIAAKPAVKAARKAVSQ